MGWFSLKMFENKGIGSYITSIIKENPKYFGVFFLLISILWLVYNIKKNEPIDFNNRNIASWDVFINGWALLLMLFIFSFFLLFD